MITYFVLKDNKGKTAGCVRLENGRVRSSCPCTLLLEDGTVLKLDDQEESISARVLGAAVRQGDSNAAWGTAPGVKLTGAELLYRLRQGKAPTAELIPEPEAVPAVGPEPEPEPMPDPALRLEPVPDLESVPQPEPVPVVEPEPAFEPQPETAPVVEPEPEPAPEPADSASAAADFGLLIHHAEEVYESILHPPLIEEKTSSPEAPKSEEIERQDGQAGKESWFSEAERLIARTRQPAWGRRRG